MPDPAFLDMLAAARAAIRFTDGITWDLFAADEMRQAAVIHKLTVLGEAAKRVPEGSRLEHPAIPWRSVTGLRDRLVHEYHKIAIEVVWRIVENDLPGLVAAIEQLDMERPE